LEEKRSLRGKLCLSNRNRSADGIKKPTHSSPQKRVGKKEGALNKRDAFLNEKRKSWFGNHYIILREEQGPRGRKRGRGRLSPTKKGGTSPSWKRKSMSRRYHPFLQSGDFAQKNGGRHKKTKRVQKTIAHGGERRLKVMGKKTLK